MPVFYAPNVHSEVHQLDETESKHCIRVLRLKKGDEISLVDGVGGFYTAEIIEDDQRKCVVAIKDKRIEDSGRNFYLHIALSPPKNIKRFEWFLEKAVEIGVDEITPLICKRSERDSVNLERAETIIITAMKQSMKAIKPAINDVTDFKSFLEGTNEIASKKVDLMIGYIGETEKNLIQDAYTKGNGAVVLIGPTGDFTEEEIRMANDFNYKTITMGENVLRTETAGVVACSLLNFINS
ncbi:MAG: 16S rRNA (uracil(1498)-N(3))-methyltransferase [Bacteroidetes bacterium]|nr:16S rRNA (uracil(1498)-N(3))-methyltransferase [Bacteroidota bacterium]